MNLEKLAQLAGVSLSTASKAFSGSHEISDKTRFHEREFEYEGVKYRISNQWGIGNLPHLLESMEYEKCLKDFSVIRC